MIHKMYSLYKHIPQDIIEAYFNEYDLALEPNPNLKVITLAFKTVGDDFSFLGSFLSDYDSTKNTRDYFYRPAPGTSVSPFLSLYVSDEGLQLEQKTDDNSEISKIDPASDDLETRYSPQSKDYKNVMSILKKSFNIEPRLSGLHDYFLHKSESVLAELPNYLKDSKKTLFILTVQIDDLYIGQSPLFQAIRKSTARNINQDFYMLGDKRITGSDQVCSMCRSVQSELWGYVSIYNFYTSKTEFASIAGGLKKELAHRNNPVCPECATKLKKMRPVIDKYFSFKFCGFDYFLIPEGIREDVDTMDMIIEIMVSQYNHNPGEMLNLHTRLGEFCLGERKKIIDSYSKEVFDYLAETNDSVSYTLQFFEENQNQFKILMSVEDVFPCQFTKIYQSKQKAEAHDIFQDLPGKKNEQPYNLEFRFDLIKEFLPIADKINGDFSKAFLETTRSVFMNKEISLSYLLQRIMGRVGREFANDLNYNLLMRKAFLMLKFLLYMGVIKLNNYKICKEVAMSEPFAEFFEEHSDFFNSNAKKYSFMTGVLTQRLLNIQLRDSQASPFRKRLNNLKLNPDILHRIYTEAIEKLEQYGKNYYKELESEIGELIVQGGIDRLSNDEISFYFTLGMTLYKKFKSPESTEQEDNGGNNV